MARLIKPPVRGTGGFIALRMAERSYLQLQCANGVTAAMGKGVRCIECRFASWVIYPLPGHSRAACAGL